MAVGKTERPLEGLKVTIEDQEAYVAQLRRKGMDILLSFANIPQIAAIIFHGEKITDFSSQDVVEPEKGYVAIRYFWNLQEIENNGFDPQTKRDSIEIGVSVATKRLSFVQAGETSPLKGAGGMKLGQGVEYLSYKDWKENPGLIREALARAIKNPQQIKIPIYRE